jgi:hypothetical protein
MDHGLWSLACPPIFEERRYVWAKIATGERHPGKDMLRILLTFLQQRYARRHQPSRGFPSGPERSRLGPEVATLRLAYQECTTTTCGIANSAESVDKKAHHEIHEEKPTLRTLSLPHRHLKQILLDHFFFLHLLRSERRFAR